MPVLWFIRSQKGYHRHNAKPTRNDSVCKMPTKRVFIPSMDQRFGYVYTIPAYERPNILHFNTRKQYYQLQKIEPTGLSSHRKEILDHTLAVKIGRDINMHWKVDFGHGSSLNKSGRPPRHLGHAYHPHWATITAALKALDIMKKICASHRHPTKIVFITESEMLVNILGWGKNARHELSKGGFPHDMVSSYHEIEKSIHSIEKSGHRFVSFWCTPRTVHGR